MKVKRIKLRKEDRVQSQIADGTMDHILQTTKDYFIYKEKYKYVQKPYSPNFLNINAVLAPNV